jgi:ribosomal-protein-alanine N-acetyltransferase
MIRHDLPEILAIERLAFPAPWSWSERNFISFLRGRNRIGMVAEHGERIAGYVVYSLFSDSVEINRLATRCDLRRRGVATQLVEKLKLRISPGWRTRLWCFCRETNLGAQLFFQSAGFRYTLTAREFWDDDDEDAYRFEFRARSEP